MVGIVVLSHGQFASEAVKSAAMLVGHGERLASEGVLESDTPETFFTRVHKIIEQVDDGSGVIALVDLFGGTPNNTVYQLKREKNVRIITGFNLPMLIYAITERTETTTQAELVDALMRVGASEIKEFGKA
ncbi:MAG TPA: PTS sugar transporter subunit IIA [Candidatus Cryosericum sp.]|nr:PTS sugar transporter subunit IIA [Candidatus Cryosericum sp.]